MEGNTRGRVVLGVVIVAPTASFYRPGGGVKWNFRPYGCGMMLKANALCPLLFSLVIRFLAPSYQDLNEEDQIQFIRSDPLLYFTCNRHGLK